MSIVRRSSEAPNGRFPLAPRPWRLVVVLAVALGLAVPVRAADPKPASTPYGLSEFMGGLAQQESGGRYDARNRVSGAYGKYQIMPSNWPGWARLYLHFTKAPQTARNQDRVAAGKLTDLHDRLGTWDRTAYWWLTGKTGARPTWSAYASHYVDNVMLGYRVRSATPPPGGVKVLDDSTIIRYAGDWKVARYHSYFHGGVHFSKAKGAAVGLRFVGRGISIDGPKGPTRGRVAVYVDGRLLKVVDLRARSFQARSVLASVQWAARGEHWVELRNLATRGRPYVAIDRMVIRG